AIGSEEALKTRYRARRKIPGHARILLPGLINGHTHAAMTLFRGIADDRDLMDWLVNYIFPLENRFVDHEFVRVGTQLACWEMIAGGTTTFVDMYHFPEAVAEVVADCGLRAVVAAAVIEQQSPYADNWQQSIAKAVKFARHWRNRNPRITPALGPHAAYTITPPRLREIRRLANDLRLPISIHVAETRAEVADIRDRYGRTPVRHLETLGFFQGRTIAAHVVWPEPREIALLAKAGVGVIHNPSSNLKLASGIAPVTKMLAAGINVGLGTDGAASNNDLDMWEEMRLAAVVQKADDRVGALTVGRRADMIQVSLSAARMLPLYDVVSHLVYVTHADDVQTVIVDGRILMQDRVLGTLDTERIRAAVARLAARLTAAAAE
ncbi:MAG: amidohydrolase family protein, partial [Methyloligellaceae bacterium]